MPIHVKAGLNDGAPPSPLQGEAIQTASAQPTLARLMIWLSPAYPVGSYSYSHGLEWTVEARDVKDAATLGTWVEDVLAHGAGRSDVIFLAEAWRAAAADDW
jgi:urease accessory protein